LLLDLRDLSDCVRGIGLSDCGIELCPYQPDDMLFEETARFLLKVEDAIEIGKISTFPCSAARKVFTDRCDSFCRDTLCMASGDRSGSIGAWSLELEDMRGI
jgi:hypothetical protein